MINSAQLTDLWQDCINIFFPPLCSLCENTTQDAQSLCHECVHDIYYTPQDQCVKCGYPFDHHVGDNMLCTNCIINPPYFDRAYAPFIYKGTARRMILTLKHLDGTYLAPLMANYLFMLLQKEDIQADLILAIPLHIKKHFIRRYNQSSLVAKSLSKISKIHFDPDTLFRIKDGTQKGKNYAQRQKDIKNNFIIKKGESLKGKNIIIIDDVMTTGATANETCKLIRKYDPKNIYFLSIARVKKDGNFEGKGTVDF